MWQKRRILEVIHTLLEAHSEIRGFFDSGDVYTAVQLLSECQNCVESIVEVASESELETAAEAYYEALYNTSIGKTPNLDQCLCDVEMAVEGVRLKKEVVFMPYKYSMWDSLESIYLAAQKDKDCECFVVVIPFYDKFPDGTLGKLNDEGREFPADVPIIDWQSYDVENRHPDIVFIHNPYDAANAVTQVHEKFFAGNLKSYTNKLIYCPYYIDSEFIMPPFALAPAVIISDRTMVESENVRLQYLNSIESGLKEKGYLFNQFNFPERIVALGSPKFDKVLNTKREAYEYPQSWLQMFERVDGTRKKVLLYNSSIEAMLSNTNDLSEQYLMKIEAVFQYFSNRSDTVMIWRPHPLLEQTIRSLRFPLLSKYLNLVNQFQIKQIGIYDDSGDLYRALTAADACYGDKSSVNFLLQAVGKPTLIQSMSVACHMKKTKSKDKTDAALMKIFARGNYNNLIFHEAEDGIELNEFVENLEVIGRHCETQSELYRNRFANSDGTTGQKIFKYAMEL